MNYSKIYYNDVVNGEGIRVSLFVSGCSHGCKGCYNQSAWDYRAGEPFTQEIKESLLQACTSPFIDGLSLLGGDPLMPKNFDTVLDLCKAFKSKFPSKTIWLWSGYTLSEIENNHASQILDYVDVLIDGKFIQEKYKKMSLKGSTNQKIYHKIDFRFIETN